MLDRRLFLTWSGSALALAGTASQGQSATGVASAHDGAGAGAHGTADPLASPVGMTARDGLPARLIDTGQAFAGRLAALSAGRLSLAAAGEDGTAKRAQASEIEIGFEHDFVAAEPGLALLDVIAGFGGGPLALDAWLLGLGGQAYWDEIAARSDMKPLLVGESGSSGFVWCRHARIDGHEAGLRHAVPGLAGRALNRFGLTPVEFSDGEAASTIRAGRVDLVEVPDAAGAVALAAIIGDIGHWWRGTINPGPRAISVRIPLVLWERMGEPERAIIRAAAADTVRMMRAVDHAHAGELARTLAGLTLGEPNQGTPPLADFVKSEIERALVAAATTEPRLGAMVAVLAAIDHPLALSLARVEGRPAAATSPTA